MPNEIPDNTAVRVALWRALHVEIDAPPHILNDTIGLQLAAPPDDWRDRGDMNPQFTKTFRAAIVARARFIEDLVEEQSAKGVTQYVILGAGLDTFAQRKPDFASRLNVYEIDAPTTQAWKRQRLIALGYGIPKWLHLVPVNFESGASWLDELANAGFDKSRPAVVVSTGVSLYLTKEANAATLRQIATLVPGSTLAMTYILPLGHIAPEERSGMDASMKGARAGGTPFISLFTGEEITDLARNAGFKHAEYITGETIAQRYFANRSDGLQGAKSEELLVATT